MTIEGERYVAIEGRIKDLINRGGEKINAEEVELLLLRHPSVRAAAVVPMPDRASANGPAPTWSWTARSSPCPEVHEHFAALEVAKFKWPERLEHLPEMPRTPVGKTDKKRLAADIARKVATPQSGSSSKRRAGRRW